MSPRLWYEATTRSTVATPNKLKSTSSQGAIEHSLTAALANADSSTAAEERLYERVIAILESARTHVSRSVNAAMVQAYWHIGREIVEVEQGGRERAAYGEQVIDRLALRLAKRYSQGFGVRTLRRVRQFYLTYQHGSLIPSMARGRHEPPTNEGTIAQTEIRSAVLSKSTDVSFPTSLSWSHYLVLMRVANASARAFYEIEAARANWAARDLERQVASMLYERLAKSRDKDKVLALAREGQQVSTPADVLKDPLVLEFLDMPERPAWRERDLEQAIIDRLEAFLLELGRGFCFVARQKRVSIDGDHFYVDLVFYNRLLRCFVLLDLKLGKLTHQDLGQIQMYANYFDRYEREPHEAATIGIVLCSDKNDAMVRITLPVDNERIMATQYQLYLPTEEELRAELEREREEAERRLISE